MGGGEGLRDEVSETLSIWWREIYKSCGGANDLKWFDESVERCMGNRDDILFWRDVWLGQQSMVDKYPRLLISKFYT